MTRPSDEPPPFSPRATRWVVGVCTGSILLGALLGALGEDISSRSSNGSNGFSPSALGQEGFRLLLGRLGIPVISSRDSSGRKASAGGVLLVAEPEVLEGLHEMLAASRASLLVLPKWRGRPHPAEPRWVVEVTPVPESRVEAVLHEAGVKAYLLRIPGAGTGWKGAPGPPPTIRFAQLLSGNGLTPLIQCDEGVLLAEAPHPGGGAKRLLVLSDPDILANHGLGKGGNAELAVAIEESLRRGKGAVVMDETIHGFTRETGLWREMLRFPLALSVVHALLLAGLLVLGGGARFGAPLPAAPVIEAGKRVLVENTADLLLAGGHSRDVLVRYWRASYRDVAETVHAPGTPGSSESVAFLDRLSEARGLGRRASELGGRVRSAVEAPSQGGRLLVETSADIHAWRKEMTRGH